MIFRENRLLADNSQDISYLIYSKKRKMSQKMLSAAVVIGALRVKVFMKCSQGIVQFNKQYRFKYFGLRPTLDVRNPQVQCICPSS